MNEQSDIYVDILIKKSKSNNKFDICPLISNCALDIICGNFLTSNLETLKNLLFNFKKLQCYNSFIINYRNQFIQLIKGTKR